MATSNSAHNDVLEGIRDKATNLLNSALRRSKNQKEDQALSQCVFQIGYMLGLDGQTIEKSVNVHQEAANKDVPVQQRFNRLLLQLIKLHNEMAHLQLPRLDGLGLSLGQALNRAFHVYARKQLGQGRYQYDVDNPRLNDSQLFKMCQDAGLLEPQGNLPGANLHVIMAAHKTPGSGSLRADFKTFMRLLSSVAAELVADVYIPIAGLGLQTRPRPILKALLWSLDPERHWNLPNSSGDINDETLRMLQTLPWEEPGAAYDDNQDRPSHNRQQDRPSHNRQPVTAQEDSQSNALVARLMARLDDLETQVTVLSQAHNDSQAALDTTTSPEQQAAAAAAAATEAALDLSHDHYLQLKSQVDELNVKERDRAKLWRKDMERTLIDITKLQKQMASVEERLLALEEAFNDHCESSDVAVGNVQDRLTALVRKTNQLSQEKLDVTLFGDLQASLATLDRDKVSTEGRLSHLEADVQLLRLGNIGPASSGGGGKKDAQPPPPTAMASETNVSMQLPAPVSMLAEQIAMLQAEHAGAQAVASDNLQTVNATLAEIRADTASLRDEQEKALAALQRQLSALMQTMNDELGEGGNIHNATARLQAELQQHEAKQVATELAVHHVIGQLEELNTAAENDEDLVSGGPSNFSHGSGLRNSSKSPTRINPLEMLVSEAISALEASPSGASNRSVGLTKLNGLPDEPMSLDVRGGTRRGDEVGQDEEDVESGEARLLRMTGLTAAELAAQQEEDEARVWARLAEQLPPGEDVNDSDWDTDSDDGEGIGYVALAPITRTRRIATGPGELMATSYRAAIAPNAPAGAAAKGLAAGTQAVPKGAAGDVGMDARTAAVQQTLHQVMNDFARQVGADIRLDQLTPAELAAAERLATRLLGAKAPETIAASARKAVIEQGVDCSTAVAKGTELVAVALSASEPEAVVAARLATSVLGPTNPLAKAALASATCSRTSSRKQRREPAGMVVVDLDAEALGAAPGTDVAKVEEETDVVESVDNPLEAAALHAREVLAEFGTDSPEAAVAIEALAFNVQQVAEAAGGKLPADVQALVQMALSGYPEDSDAATRATKQLGEHVFSGGNSRHYATELKDMVALIYGDRSPEALAVAAVARLPEAALAAEDAEQAAALLPAIERHHGPDSAELAATEAQVAVLSHGYDSYQASAAILKAMRVAFSQASSQASSARDTPKMRGAFGSGHHPDVEGDGSGPSSPARAYGGAVGPVTNTPAKVKHMGVRPRKSFAWTEDAATAGAPPAASAPSIIDPRLVPDIILGVEGDEERISPSRRAMGIGTDSYTRMSGSGNKPRNAMLRFTIDEDKDEGQWHGDQIISEMLSSSSKKPKPTFRPRSSRRFKTDADGLPAEIPAEVMVNMPSDVHQLAHAVNALVDNVREVKARDNSQANAVARSTAASVYSLSVAVQDQGQAQSQIMAKQSLLEAAVLKVAKQMDSIMKDLERRFNNTDQQTTTFTTYNAYTAARNRFGGPPVPNGNGRMTPPYGHLSAQASNVSSQFSQYLAGMPDQGIAYQQSPYERYQQQYQQEELMGARLQTHQPAPPDTTPMMLSTAQSRDGSSLSRHISNDSRQAAADNMLPRIGPQPHAPSPLGHAILTVGDTASPGNTSRPSPPASGPIPPHMAKFGFDSGRMLGYNSAGGSFSSSGALSSSGVPLPEPRGSNSPRPSTLHRMMRHSTAESPMYAPPQQYMQPQPPQQPLTSPQYSFEDIPESAAAMLQPSNSGNGALVWAPLSGDVSGSDPGLANPGYATPLPPSMPRSQTTSLNGSLALASSGGPSLTPSLSMSRRARISQSGGGAGGPPQVSRTNTPTLTGSGGGGTSGGGNLNLEITLGRGSMDGSGRGSTSGLRTSIAAGALTSPQGDVGPGGFGAHMQGGGVNGPVKLPVFQPAVGTMPAMNVPMGPVQPSINMAAMAYGVSMQQAQAQQQQQQQKRGTSRPERFRKL